MKVLVIGSGGREHALVQALAKEPGVTALYALPGNAGMKEALCLPGDPMDSPGVVATARAQGIQFCVVAPDDPLANGLVDALEEAGIPCFGPTRAAARIESSKVFSKKLMADFHIPTARWAAFDSPDPAREYALGQPYPLVIKADGLAKGKGVLIVQNAEQAQEALHSIFDGGLFGASGSRVVIEEYLEGPEVSVLALCDGQNLVPLPSAMDHKRALDDDQGLNTGGMGVIAPNPFYTPEIAERCMQQIFLPTVRAMQALGHPFRGCLFFGLMLTKDGPRVLEYNARFGDPETQAVLALVEGGLLTAMQHCRFGGLSAGDLRLKQGSACCVVMASGGYPGRFNTGYPITGRPEGVLLHYAGVKQQQDGLVTAGGRVLSLTATAPTLKQAIDRAYQATEQMHFEGAHYRRDIGRHALRAEGVT
ncbi:MAG: phosphoribosylamine--glycine ligase [Clostridiales bacterium]|nr:phosphoribosylamine--glycine ligase [Clostridiales bacterium]